MANNFLVFDEAQNNILSQSEYQSNTTRTGGILPGAAPKELYNKLFRQTSIVASAFGQALSDYGYNVADDNFTALVQAFKSALVASNKIIDPVVNATELKNINTTFLVDSALVECKELGIFRLDLTSVAPDDNENYIVPTIGTGVWTRITDSSFKGILVQKDFVCNVPQSINILKDTLVIPKFDLTPRHIINRLGSIGGFYKDTNLDGLADGWTGSNAGTYSLVNGEQTFTTTAQYGYIRPSSGLTPNRTIVAIAYVKSTDVTAQLALASATNVAVKINTGSNNFEKIGIIGTNGSFVYLTSTKISPFVPITVKDCFYVDVTDYPELVGLTNQQKLDWCLANLEYCDGIGVTKNPSLKITRKNLLPTPTGSVSVNGITAVAEDGVITLNGTTNALIRININGQLINRNNGIAIAELGYTIPLNSSYNYLYKTNVLSGSIVGNAYVALTNESAVPLGGTSPLIGGTSNVFTGKTIVNASYIYCDGGVVFNNLKINIQLEQGTTATPYEPYRESLTTIQGDFLTGDKISNLNNETVGTKLWSSKKVLYGKDYDGWSVMDATGYKIIGRAGLAENQNVICQLHDNTIIPYGDTSTGSNLIYFNSNVTYLSLPDSSTGWGETETVTENMIKARLNGWKKTGASTWVSIVNLTTLPTIQSDDYVSDNIAPDYDGIQIHYMFTIPKPIDKDSISYLAPLDGDNLILQSGINTVTLTNGVAQNERVYPKLGYGNYYINIRDNFDVNIENGSQAQNKVGLILSIMKDGVDDTSNWTIEVGAGAYGIYDAYILADNYYLDSVYTMSYDIDKAVAPQIGSGQLSYKEGISETLTNVVKTLDSKQDKNVIFDHIADSSIYEKTEFSQVVSQFAVNSATMYVRFSIPVTPKVIKKPIISPYILNILKANGFVDVTNLFVLDTRTLFNNQVVFVYSTTDATTIADIKANGVIVNCGISVDCRERF